MKHKSRSIYGDSGVFWPLAQARRGPKIRIGWQDLLPVSACVSASIARFIAFELAGVFALGCGLLADLRRRTVIAVLGVV
jgi:hypothetical protein